MRRKPGLAIMVKTPGISPIKTRLARDMGAPFALQFYQLAAQATLEVARQLPACCYFAVAERGAGSNWPKNRLWQGSGDLGARMHHVLQILIRRHGAGLLLGADAPHLDTEMLLPAVEQLGTAQRRQIYAPALDGGFWCYGSNFLTPLEPWNKVHYSEANTGAQFLAQFQNLAPLQMLACLQDVDTKADLEPCFEALSAIRNPSPSQATLMRFLQKVGSDRKR